MEKKIMEKFLVNVESFEENGACSFLAQYKRMSVYQPKCRSVKLLLSFEENVNREDDCEYRREGDGEEGGKQPKEVNDGDPPAPKGNPRPWHRKHNTELKIHAQRYRELKLRQNHRQQQKRNGGLISQNAAKRPRFQ